MRLFVLLAIFTQIGCFGKEGQFSFFAADMSDLTLLEKKFYRPSEFKKMRAPVSFETDDVIWFAYEPPSPDASALYAVSLQRKSLGYVEIDLRNLRLALGTDQLIDKFENLETGEYLLKVAADGKVLSQTSFSILEDSASDVVDYDAPADDDAEADEIIAFSR